MQITFVLPDYFEELPKACYGGWGRYYIVVSPDGKALPCHGAYAIPSLELPSVREHPSHWIWHESAAFQAFRGDAWMKEPCRSCPRKAVDFGGCRCQALALTGDAANADPVCTLSPLPPPHRRGAARARRRRRVRLPRLRRRAAARVSATAPAIVTEGLGRDYGGVRALDALDLDVPVGRAGRPARPQRRGQDHRDAAARHPARPHPGRRPDLRPRRRARARRRPAAARAWCSRRPASTASSRSRRTCASPARLAGLGGRELRAAVAAAIERAGLGPRAAQPARQLSGGWRRLVDIARATLHRPDLLILDEPTVGLDPEHRELIWTILAAERRERGTTILFSTHYLAEAEPADRVVLLSRGRVVADDDAGRAPRARSARRSPRSRARARSGWRGRSAGWAPPRPCCGPSGASGWASPGEREAVIELATAAAGHRAAARSGPRASRTSTSPRTRGGGPRERVERGRTASSRATWPARRGRPAACSAGWPGRSCGCCWSGPATTRSPGSRAGCRTRRSCFPGIVVMAALFGGDAHRDRDGVRPRVRHAAADAREPGRRAGGAGRPGHRGGAGRAAAGRDRAGLRAARAAGLAGHARRGGRRAGRSRPPSSAVLGLLVAARLRSVENFAGVINVVLFPLLFVSGALYPTAGMPAAAPAARPGESGHLPGGPDAARVRPAGGVRRGTDVLVLAATTVVAFGLTALLFDPEQRFVAADGRAGRDVRRVTGAGPECDAQCASRRHSLAASPAPAPAHTPAPAATAAAA